MMFRMRTGRIVLLLVIGLVLISWGGHEETQAPAVPPAILQSDRLLGRAMAAMDRHPAAPESALAMPADVQAALLQTGFLEGRVRVYAKQEAAEQRAFDAKWKPLLARAHTSAARARMILTHAMADTDVSAQFLLRYGELAKATDAWITAASQTANDATRMAETFGRAADGFRDSNLQQAFYKAAARARESRGRAQAAVDRADRASAALSALLNVDGDAAQVASALIDADASGLLARKWHRV